MGVLQSPLINWHDTWNIGITSIDEEHRSIVASLNELSTLLGHCSSRQEVERILAQVVVLTKEHFESEEILMESHGYPEYPQHKLEHLKLNLQLQEFEQRFAAGAADLSVPVLEYLRNWFTSHLVRCDLPYAAFLHQNKLPLV
jgi:hemerythrin-like metal-binding protein